MTQARPPALPEKDPGLQRAVRVAEGLRSAAAACAALPGSARVVLGRRLAAVADLAKRDLVAAERALTRLRRRIDAQG